MRLNYFLFSESARSEIYILSLHDALPILVGCPYYFSRSAISTEYPRTPISCSILAVCPTRTGSPAYGRRRSEEHTSELQSRGHLVCRLLLEKKKYAKHAL